jgi:cell division protease FtsH
VNTTFKDVAGLSEAKQEVEEIVEFLRNPTKFTKLGGKIPKGALLVGPPGTGKTLLAKAVAGEANVPFFSMSGSDFVEMFVGVGASRVRDLFKQAKEKAPCIVFIDEIDAIGRARGRNPNFGSNDERENTLNQLLTEMDGFDTNSGVIVLAATNRADILDRALMRAGRFDRQIHVELPDLNERGEIFQVHLKPLKLDNDVQVDFLAKQTPGFSGADIANVCNEAALIAARKNHETVARQDFLDAVDRIVGGLEKKNKIISLDEKKTIAFHEAGHATISWVLPYAHPLVKVTIVPRGKALGAAWYLPEERSITTREQLLDEMCSALGGRAAEEVVFGRVSSGAQNDLERITKQAYAMVSIFGMSEKIGTVSFYDSSGQSDYSFTKPYSEKTAQLIDEEAKKIIDQEYQRALKILREYGEGHQKLAQLLLDREVIFSEDMEHIFGKRHFDKHAVNLEHTDSESLTPAE